MSFIIEKRFLAAFRIVDDRNAPGLIILDLARTTQRVLDGNNMADLVVAVPAKAAVRLFDPCKKPLRIVALGGTLPQFIRDGSNVRVFVVFVRSGKTVLVDLTQQLTVFIKDTGYVTTHRIDDSRDDAQMIPIAGSAIL